MADKPQYVTLGVAGELLAVPVEHVQEILQVQPVSRLPQAPAHLLGLIDVRGQGVPVVDLRLKLGFEAAPDTENTRIIVLNVTMDTRVVPFGLKTDRVFEVTVLDEETLEPPPQLGTRWHSDFIAGIGRSRGAFVTVMDLGHLFTSGEKTLLTSPAQMGVQAA